jgi:chaperone modulatory protein CbpM
MSHTDNPVAGSAIVEEDITLTIVELCQACGTTEEHVTAWVFEGALEPVGDSPRDWRFTGDSLRRARLALWLTRDLEINPPGVALALDLLDRIAELQARLQRSGLRR